MTVEREGFARRWARLKRLPSRDSALPAEAVEPEEAPPALDSLALDEIGPWLRRRVPDLWKQAAMRRIWLGDPAIRNFIGPADYAWDWNTPGGAPGYGPMRAMDDLARLLDRAIGAPEPVKPVAEAPDGEAPGGEAPGGEAPDGEAPEQVPVAVSPPAPVVANADFSPQLDPPARRAVNVAAPPLRRRGGKAAPV